MHSQYLHEASSPNMLILVIVAFIFTFFFSDYISHGTRFVDDEGYPVHVDLLVPQVDHLPVFCHGVILVLLVDVARRYQHLHASAVQSGRCPVARHWFGGGEGESGGGGGSGEGGGGGSEAMFRGGSDGGRSDGGRVVEGWIHSQVVQKVH